MEKKIDFEKYPWHDATVDSVYIDRKNAGRNDRVEMKITWPPGNELSEVSTLFQFLECYQIKMTWNFGIIGADTILTAQRVEKDAELESLLATWKMIGLDLSGLSCYVFNTNSTNSIVKIFCRSVSVLE